MMSDCSCCDDCCPEVVPLTQNVTELTLDDVEIEIGDPSAGTYVKSVVVTLPGAFMHYQAWLVDAATINTIQSASPPAVTPTTYWSDVADENGQVTFTFNNLGGATGTWYLVIECAGITAISDAITLTGV